MMTYFGHMLCRWTQISLRRTALLISATTARLWGGWRRPQEAAAVARIEREKRDAERHEGLRDILFTLSASAVEQRDELEKLRKGQEVGEKWQKTATKRGLVIGALTLLATLMSIGVAVYPALYLGQTTIFPELPSCARWGAGN